MVNFKKIYHFSRFQRSPTFSRGASNFFEGGSNCLFPIGTHITCDFPGGGPDPLFPPPSGSALEYRVATNFSHWLKVQSSWFENYIFAKKYILISFWIFQYYFIIHSHFITEQCFIL